MDIIKDIVKLYKSAATQIPEDIEAALKNSDNNTVMQTVLKNCEIAKKGKPICQDTGIPYFWVERPKEISEKEIRRQIEEATEIATKEVPLRPNAVDSLSGKNVGNKPVIYFSEADKLKITLMLKGGGSENVSTFYKLPDTKLNAERTLEGVQKCILDAVYKAQGKGCPPYIIGVCIGGSIDDVMKNAKEQLLRKIDDKCEMFQFEKETLEKINKMGIGPLGLGGKTTALAVKVTSTYRHPASYFVGISFGCWCLRRKCISL